MTSPASGSCETFRREDPAGADAPDPGRAAGHGGLAAARREGEGRDGRPERREYPGRREEGRRPARRSAPAADMAVVVPRRQHAPVVAEGDRRRRDGAEVRGGRAGPELARVTEGAGGAGRPHADGPVAGGGPGGEGVAARRKGDAADGLRIAARRALRIADTPMVGLPFGTCISSRQSILPAQLRARCGRECCPLHTAHHD